MSWFVKFLQSSIGMKIVMAVTGVMLVGFVMGHLAGNLTIFAGPDAINAYAKKLRGLGRFLWVIRFGLIGIVLAHIVAAARLTEKNSAARPIAYAQEDTVRAPWTSRTMLLSGLMVVAYVIYHLAHFTLRVTNPEISHLTDAHGHHDVYSMVVLSFQNVFISGIYVVAMILLGMHLNHGIISFFQTLGVNHPTYTPLIRKLGPILGAIIVIGYISIPTAVLLGWIKPLQGGA